MAAITASTHNGSGITAGTLDGFELRLNRLSGLVGAATGSSIGVNNDLDVDQVEATTVEANTITNTKEPVTVTARLQQLEAALDKLAQTSRPIAELLYLYKHYEDLFPAGTTLPPTNSFNTREKAAMVNACAPSFSATASQLSAVQDQPIPPAEQSAALIALQPRIAEVEHRQAVQNTELARLRLRTARVLQRWYDISVLGGNECWAEWEDRLMELEKTVTRAETRQEEDKGPQ